MMWKRSLRNGSLLTLEQREQTKLQIVIAILFSIVTIVSGFLGITYIPISDDKIMDLAIVGFVFATLIGGYGVGIPLALIWSLASYYNIEPQYQRSALWYLIIEREIFGLALVFFYDLAKKAHHRSPYNVYRTIIAGITIKALIGLPLEIINRGVLTAIKIRGEVGLLEIALCSVFMMLLIKHLRQIHLLNGVKKKGEKNNGD